MNTLNTYKKISEYAKHCKARGTNPLSHYLVEYTSRDRTVTIRKYYSTNHDLIPYDQFIMDIKYGWFNNQYMRHGTLKVTSLATGKIVGWREF